MYPIPDKNEELNSFQNARRFYTSFNVSFALKFWIQDWEAHPDYSRTFAYPFMKVSLTGLGKWSVCMPHDAPLVLNGENFNLSEVSNFKRKVFFLPQKWKN